MQVTLERTGPCQAKIHFTVPHDEWKATFRQGLQHISQNAQMKGFRPGKVPPQILEKQFGSQVRNDAIEYFVRKAYEQAVGENELKIVGFQRVNLDEVKILENVDWKQSFEVSLRPEITLGDYKGIEIESELEPVMDQEVENAIQNLKGQQSRPEPVGDAGLPADGMAVVDVEWILDGKTVLKRENLRVAPKTPSPGVEAAAFELALTGVKDGDTREIAMVMPQEIEPAEMRGKAATTRISVKQAFRMIPPTDEDIRKIFGAADDAALRKTVAEKIGEAKVEQENTRIEGAILEKLLASHTIELPSMMVDEQQRARLEQMKAQMKQQGAPEERANEEAEKQKDAAREAAEKGLRALFLIQTIGEKEKQLVTREDVEAELQRIAERNRAKVEEVRDYYQKNKLFDQMAVEILERKVRRFLRENAKVSTPS